MNLKENDFHHLFSLFSGLAVQVAMDGSSLQEPTGSLTVDFSL